MKTQKINLQDQKDLCGLKLICKMKLKLDEENADS